LGYILGDFFQTHLVTLVNSGMRNFWQENEEQRNQNNRANELNYVTFIADDVTLQKKIFYNCSTHCYLLGIPSKSFHLKLN
jgi:hypothetical protein